MLLSEWLALDWGCLVAVLLSVVSRASSTGCPADVTYSTDECLTRYRTQMGSVGQESNFYSGVDVEVIRLLCDSLRRSVECATTIKSSCPDTEHTQIEMVLGDVINVAELCSVSNLLEVYARHQNCYTRLSAASETCYQKYRAETQGLDIEIEQGEQEAVIDLCRNFRTLVKCIKTNVVNNCQPEAGELVEYLVKPAIKYSQYCRNDSLTSTTLKPTEPNKPWAQDPYTVNSAISQWIPIQKGHWTYVLLRLLGLLGLHQINRTRN